MLTQASVWMRKIREKFEKNMLSKIKQSQKEKYCIIPLHEVLREVKFIDTERRKVTAKG